MGEKCISKSLRPTLALILSLSKDEGWERDQFQIGGLRSFQGSSFSSWPARR